MNGAQRPSPTVLECGRFCCVDHSAISAERLVQDYELDYTVAGNRTMWVDGHCYAVTPGSVIFRRPGQRVRSTCTYDMYTLTLDFSGQKGPHEQVRHRFSGIQAAVADGLLDTLPTVFTPLHTAELATDYLHIMQTYRLPDKAEECRLTVQHLLCLLQADALSHRLGTFPAAASPVNTAMEFLQQNYARSNLRLADVADAVHLNKSYLIRLFRRQFGYTPGEYLTTIRLQQAKWRLLYTTQPVYAVAQGCGFDNPQYFIAKFKAVCGQTPENYRRSHMVNKSTV